MKVAITADIHVHPWQEHSVLIEGVPSRLFDCINVLADIREECRRRAVYNLIIAGDLFHKRGVINTQAFNLVTAELMKFKKRGIEVYVLPGNHDQADLAGTVDAIQPLAKSGVVYGIKVLGWMQWMLSSPDEELAVRAFSYCDGVQTFKQRLRDSDKAFRTVFKPDTPNITICHHGFTGARVGSVLEYQVKEPISPKLLEDISTDFVFSGHYHEHQPIGGSAKAYYVGAPLAHVRGDGPHRGFVIYDSSTHTFERVPLKAPRFVVLDQKAINSENLRRVSGNFVDVVYEELPCAPETYATRLVDAGARGVKLCPVQKERRESEKRLDVDLSTSQKELLEKYIDLRGVSDEDRERLFKLGKELLDESEK